MRWLSLRGVVTSTSPATSATPSGRTASTAQAADAPPAEPQAVKFDLVSATEKALLQAPSGVVYHAEEELGRYSIDFAVRDRTFNVVIDGFGGLLDR